MALHRRRLRAVPLLVLALAATACGSSSKPIRPTIDQQNLQSAIEVSIAQQKHESSIVQCPKHVVAAKGVTFTCTATLASGQQVPFAVIGLDTKGNVHYAGFPTAARSTAGTARSTTKKQK